MGIGKPRPAESGRGELASRSGGSRTGGEGVIIVFMTLEELRLFGPLGLRIWLKVNRPPGRAKLRPGVAGEIPFDRHQTAVSKEEGL